MWTVLVSCQDNILVSFSKIYIFFPHTYMIHRLQLYVASTYSKEARFWEKKQKTKNLSINLFPGLTHI